MPSKDRRKRLEYARLWYQRNREFLNVRDRVVRRLRRRRQRSAAAELVWQVKLRTPCKRCGEADPVCLVFHHKRASSKDTEIANAVNQMWGPKRLLREIAKCIVLCSNCHLKLHYNRSMRRMLSKRRRLVAAHQARRRSRAAASTRRRRKR